MRSNSSITATGVAVTLSRARFVKADDSKKLQEAEVRVFHDEAHKGIERFQEYGFSLVPLPPEQAQGGKAAEAVIVYLGAHRSHPVVIAIDDRRHRPKNFKPGESAHYDDQGQYSKIARDGHHKVAKQHTLTAAGDEIKPRAATKPDTTFELNEQLKGLAARLAQAEHNLHGLFDVTSEFRKIVQDHIPEVAAVADRLTQDPSGLPAMADAIAGKEMDYLQKQVTQALGKFLSPNLAGLASLLSGGIENTIGNLTTQIAGLATSNPVVGQVEGLVQEMADLATSGAEASLVAKGTAALQSQITALTAANPIVGQVTGLRSTLQGLIDQAGAALNFLEPQKRLVKGVSKSLRLQKNEA